MPDTQTASTSGHGNVIVQNTGDGVSIVVSRPHLTLTRHLGFRTRSPEIDLLAPYGRRVALCGRDAELAALRAFAESPRSPESSVAVRVLTGDGGSGKTRLALECCDRLSDAGWDAGFVTGDELARFFAGQNLAQWGWQKPTFLVVDYAASHAQALKSWLAELATRAPGSASGSAPDPTSGAAPPLRLLLLERHADTQSGWWQSVFADGGWGSHSVRMLCGPPEPVRLAPVANEERVRILQALLDETGSQFTLPLTDARFWQQLDGLTWGGQPLFLLMAALLMSERGTAALALSRTDLAFALAGRERNRLQALAQARGLAPELVVHLAACVTLAQGAPRAALRAFAAAETAALGYTDAPARLVDALAEALPGKDGSVAPLLPDVIGEAFVLDVLRDGVSAAVRCHAAFGHAVGVSLIRCAQDFAGVRTPVLGWLDAVAEALTGFAAIAELANALPQSSVALAEFSVRFSERVLHAVDDIESNGAKRAGWLNNVSAHLAALGRRDDALATCEEAVTIRRRLAAARPDAFEPGLAGSLNNVSAHLAALGRREAALATCEEAVTIYRGLAATRPDAFEPDLATSLNNVSAHLADLGHREDALAACKEAVTIYRRLAAARPDAFEPGLAMSLNNVSNRLAALGRRDDALAACEEAVMVYRRLAATRPDAFEPDLATSLNNISGCLADLGHCEAALTACEEAVAIRRRLAAARPDVFEPDLAGSLGNLSNQLAALGRNDEALVAIHEAVARYTPYFLRFPDACRSWMGMMLQHYVKRCGEANAEPDAELLAPLLPHFPKGSPDA